MKLLVLGLIVLAVVWLLRGKNSADRAAPPAARHAGGKAPESMARCAHCGVHFPASEAVTALSGARYCSEEHRLRHAS